jgi:predicted nucleic acid-binding protein
VKLLLDTTVFIDVLRGLETAVTFLRDAVQQDHELWSVSVVRTEVLAGMRRGEEEATLALLDGVRWLDVTVDLADDAGELARRHLRSHRGVDTVDSLLGAGALALGARMCTSNVRHFPMLDGLQPAY